MHGNYPTREGTVVETLHPSRIMCPPASDRRSQWQSLAKIAQAMYVVTMDDEQCVCDAMLMNIPKALIIKSRH